MTNKPVDFYDISPEHDSPDNIKVVLMDNGSVEIRLTHETELIYCFEKDGVLYDKDDESSVIKEIDLNRFQELKAEGIVADGMIPKLSNAFKAIEKGVARVIIKHARNLGNETGTILK